MMIFHSSSKEDTVKIAQLLAEQLTAPAVIAFFGDLGAGKTAFTGGLAKGLGYQGQTFSPTFAIVNCYEGGRMPLYHFDMYRVENWEDLYSTGYFDYLEENGIIAVEWSENIRSALPEDRIEVEIKRGQADTNRVITITATGGISLEDFSDRLC